MLAQNNNSISNNKFYIEYYPIVWTSKFTTAYLIPPQSVAGYAIMIIVIIILLIY